MRVLLIVFCCAFLNTTKASDFIEGGIIGVAKRSPTQSNPPIFINTVTGAGVTKFVRDTWSEVDVSNLVPGDTKAVYMTGNLIITHGNANEICDLTVAYRNKGETHDYGYIGQAIETDIGAGQRSGHGSWVPVTNGKFEFKWTATHAEKGTWPAHCGYGINLSLVSYMR